MKQQINSIPGESWNDFRSLRRHRNIFRFQYTDINETRELVEGLDVHKSPGFDNISCKLIVECADELVPHIVKLFNNSIGTSIFPDLLKIQKITPIPKEISADKVEKYCPIAVLSILDKIFEKLTYKQLSAYLEMENLLTSYQYGFRKGCGADEAVINAVNYICDCLDRGYSGVGGVFYDFSKAFDLVKHSILIEKMALQDEN